MTEILITIVVGTIVAIVSQLVGHYLSIKRLEHECEEQ